MIQPKTQLLPCKKMIVFLLCLMTPVIATWAQEKVTVQIKTFTPEMEAFRNVEVSINGGPFITIGSKGSVLADLSTSDFPIKSILIKNDQLEAASWIFSKGVVEIIIRKKSYQMTTVAFYTSSSQPIQNLKVKYSGKRILDATTDQHGKITLPLALNERINAVNQLSTSDQFELKSISFQNNEYVVVADRIVTEEPPIPVQEKQQPITAKEYFRDFDLSMIDSIQSLTVFYAIFKNYQINELSADARRRVDTKFNQLVEALQDSVSNRSSASLIGRINDSTLVVEDIRSLIAQARQERTTLDEQRTAFDAKIKMITDKLEAGISTMQENERMELLSELSLLEQMLIENEKQFFRNQNDYKQIIASIKEKYFNLVDLENRLSESEAQRLAEQRIFRQRLFLISGIVLVFAALVVMLIIISRKLHKQKKELAAANAQVTLVNENLEGLVAERTKMLAVAHRELDTFLYRASHDMRSPVRSILGLCNIANRLAVGESKQLIERVIDTAINMDKLLKKLSLISEINQPSDFTEVSLKAAINDTYNELQAKHPVKIQFRLDCPNHVVISCYRNLVQIVLTNILENSLFFSSLETTRTPEVYVHVQQRNESVSITIRDNGTGVDEDIKNRLFDMFFKGTEKSSGHGLGLYIVSKAIEALHGNVQVESLAGVYTSFVIKLPLEPTKVQSVQNAVERSVA